LRAIVTADLAVHTFATHTLLPGDSPLIISVPHAGTAVPQELAPRLTPLALDLPDTDWHVARLYDFAPALGATMIVARYTRYLIDLNRPPDDAALYSAAAQTGLCPTLSFGGEVLYRDGTTKLAAAEIERRREQYWQPYHDALRARLDDTQRRFGYALLLDAHSIRSVVPRLFPGVLPDINVGTFDGRSCARALTDALRARLAAAPRYSQVFDGRFKGGYITRHYGQPDRGRHALQIELAQCSYMDEAGAAYVEERALPLRELLHGAVESLLALSLASE
jgi:N-formylglutamate deformylase